MRNRVLIATLGDEQVAARIRARLRSGGLDVEALAVNQATGAATSAGPVLGSAMDLGSRPVVLAGTSSRAA